jgi:hypothetical protein
MSSLSEIDRDLDQIAVDAGRLADVRKGASARAALVLAEIDTELSSLANGARLERSVTIAIEARQPLAAVEDDGPPSGQIDVPDDVLRSSELPAVLALGPEPTPAAPVVPPLSLDLDSGETPFDDAESELTPVPTSASIVPPVEPPEAALLEAAPPTETRPLDTKIDDPTADLASLLGDSDPMRDEGAEPLAVAEIEPEPTMMFSAADAERFSRPAPPDEQEGLGDLELEVDEILELEDEPAEQAEAAPPRARTAPPPPPRTGPPPPPARPSEVPPSRGFLGKLLQRKPRKGKGPSLSARALSLRIWVGLSGRRSRTSCRAGRRRRR